MTDSAELQKVLESADIIERQIKKLMKKKYAIINKFASLDKEYEKLDVMAETLNEKEDKLDVMIKILSEEYNKLDMMTKMLNEEEEKLDMMIKTLEEEYDKLNVMTKIKETKYNPSSLNLDIPNYVLLPEYVKIYCDYGQNTISVYIIYNNLKFYISDRPDESYPSTFTVEKQTKKILRDPFESRDRSNLEKIYYVTELNPNDRFDYKSRKLNLNDKLNDFATIINNAKSLLGNVWSDDMAFGFCLFYYWIVIYYEGNEKYKIIHDIFEMGRW